MTRDEYRAQCIKSMKAAFLSLTDCPITNEEATCLLDSLNGIARVNPIEATEEMLHATGKDNYPATVDGFPAVWRLMSAAGDLTNPTEKKP